MTMGSDSGWLTLAGRMARPAATSSRTNSGVQTLPDGGELISGVISPRRA